MARGKSGRIVLEVDPELKQQIYYALETKQQTMKDWFVREANALIYGNKQTSLFDNLEQNNVSDKDNGDIK